jgi:hypothetical protein
MRRISRLSTARITMSWNVRLASRAAAPLPCAIAATMAA